jgi:hypothetical protein
MISDITVTAFGVDLELRVKYSFTKYRPATFHDPEEGGDLYIESVSHAGSVVELRDPEYKILEAILIELEPDE